MKRILAVCFCYAAVLFAVPFFVSRPGAASAEKGEAASPPAWGDTLKVYNHKTDKVMLLDAFDYVVGVVAAEVPATYEPEALKANAVAAYTYAIRKKEYTEAHPGYAENEHKGAHVCTNYAHCKSWKSEEEQREMWGSKYDEYRARVEDAVRAVYGETLLYEGEPALTVFYSISAGSTAACRDVWGNDVPYLQSVDSSWDENEKGFLSTVTLSDAEVKEKLADCALPDAPEEWLTVTDRAESGYVRAVTAGDKTFTGGEIRKLFSLRSNCFEIAHADGAFTFTVKGYGHGVGMSQTGSQAMALAGSGYRDILYHYYPGTVIAERYEPAEKAE
ncbi:MAG: stage II sporulation protein D [Clostridia bacterium]|nr:stage II sporulation protein D [Clostridia bacterium]